MKKTALSIRIYRLLLRLLPVDFRWDYGLEMESVFRQQEREVGTEGGKAGLMKLWWRTVIGIFKTAPGEHLDVLRQDTAYALRAMRKNIGFTIVAVVTLALGIGANTAIFSVVNAVLLESLPYTNSDRLAILWSSYEDAGLARAPASGPQLLELRARSRMFKEIAGVWASNGALTGDGEPEAVKVGFVTWNFLSTLGVTPASGRLFTEEEEGAGSPRVIIISDGLWRRRFGGDANIVGRAIMFEGRSLTVVGVLPPDFEILFPPDSSVPADIQVWIPFPYDLSASPRDLAFIRMLGRLDAGVTLEQAQSEVTSIAGQLRAEFLEFEKVKVGMEVVPLQQDAVKEIRPALLALLGAVGLVLLIACANVANLLLARAGSRQKEFALRAALGATRDRIVRQLLSESVLLALIGGGAGLLLGWLGLKLLLALRPPGLARIEPFEFNLPVLGFTFAVSLVSAILFGLAPVIESSKVNLSETLKDGGRAGSTPGKQRSRALLVVSEVALGLMLLIGAGLMIRTFTNLQVVDPGFNPEHALTFQLSLPGARYPDTGKRVDFSRQLNERLTTLPGVEAAGAISHLPLDDYPNWYSYYWKKDAPESERNTRMADHRAVTPGYFQSLCARLVAGRDFNLMDDADGRRVVIVDEALARRTWPNESAIGKVLGFEAYDDGSFVPAEAEVIGVVRHIRHHSLTTEFREQLYIPYPQSARPTITYVVRSSSDPLNLVASIRQELMALDKDLPLSKVRTMDEYVARAKTPARFTSVLSGVFAGIALLLTSVGIYGVISYSVARRTHEIGIRQALGAQSKDILRMVVGEGLGLALVGVGLGLIGAFALTRYLEGLLFNVSPTDPLTFAAVSVLLIGVALVACYVPARRAARVDPMVALRSE
ncbi:MAG: ABC transporter permease [Blastocatellia bacterium]|nr:ABC transporter permease [Blastocatellia bacterium]